MDMPDRRRFLTRSLVAAAGAAAAVTWWQRAFGGAGGTAATGAGAAATTQGPTAGGGDDVAAWRMQQLTAALATATAHGKPLLVLVVPEAQAAIVRRIDDLRKAGSVFVSVDTRVGGPVYLALGATHRGGQAVYVFLGPFW